MGSSTRHCLPLLSYIESRQVTRLPYAIYTYRMSTNNHHYLRKELQSNVHGSIITAQKLPSYDGILRNSKVTRRDSRIDIGFIEAKPARTPYPKDSTADRLKVIHAMRSSLLYLKSIVAKSDMENVVVIGVICNGNGHLSIRFYLSLIVLTGGLQAHQ